MSIIDVSGIDQRKSQLCLSCLECCKWLRFDCAAKDAEQAEAMRTFYTTRGCDVRLVKISEMTLVVVNVPIHCPHLTASGCNIYSRRPPACKNYDGRKDLMMQDICKWKELED